MFVVLSLSEAKNDEHCLRFPLYAQISRDESMYFSVQELRDHLAFYARNHDCSLTANSCNSLSLEWEVVDFCAQQPDEAEPALRSLLESHNPSEQGLALRYLPAYEDRVSRFMDLLEPLVQRFGKSKSVAFDRQILHLLRLLGPAGLDFTPILRQKLRIPTPKATEEHLLTAIIHLEGPRAEDLFERIGARILHWAHCPGGDLQEDEQKQMHLYSLLPAAACLGSSDAPLPKVIQGIEILLSSNHPMLRWQAAASLAHLLFERARHHRHPIERRECLLLQSVLQEIPGLFAEPGLFPGSPFAEALNFPRRMIALGILDQSDLRHFPQLKTTSLTVCQEEDVWVRLAASKLSELFE